MKKILAITLSIILILSSVATASAEQLTVNQTEFTIYALSDDLKDSVVIPDEYPTSAQIITSQTGCTFELVSGDATINIDENGVITAHTETKYLYQDGDLSIKALSPLKQGVLVRTCEEINPGTNVYKMTYGDNSKNITVNLIDYAEIYGEKKIDEYLSKYDLENMSEREKLETAWNFTINRNYKYDGFVSAWYEMIALGRGHLEVEADIMVKVCEKEGVNAWIRKSSTKNNDNYIGVVAEINGEYYDIDATRAGFVSFSDVTTKYQAPFGYDYVDGGIEINEYFGSPNTQTLVIPSEISGYTVISTKEFICTNRQNIIEVVLPTTLKTIKTKSFSNFSNLEKIHIPVSVESIEPRAFVMCNKLSQFTCSPNNLYYTVIDNALLNKDETEIICAPGVSGDYYLPDTVKVIGEYAFYGNDISSITSNSLVEIKEFGINQCLSLKEINIYGEQFKTLRKFAICNGNPLNFNTVTLPSSLEIIEDYAVGYYRDDVFSLTPEKMEIFKIKGEPGSLAEEYANKNGFEFVDINYKEPEPPKPIKGDANNDGVVTIEDFQEIVKMIASSNITITQTNDTNSDRDVDLIDALAVKYAVENNDLENISNFGTGEYSEKTAVIDIKTNKKEVEAGEDITIDFVLTEPADIAAIEIVGVFDNSYFEDVEIIYDETNYCKTINNSMGVVCVLNENREHNTIFSAKCEVKEPDNLITGYLLQAIDKNGNYVNVKTNSLLVKQKEIITTTQPNITTPTSPLPTQPTQSTQPTRPSQTNLKGDVDNNGEVNVEDAQEIAKMLAKGIITITDNADANSDGDIDLLDVVTIKCFVDGNLTDMKNFGTGKKSDKTAIIDVIVENSQVKEGDIITVDYVLTEPADIAAINIISTFSDGDCELLEVISSVGETYRTSDNKYAGIVRMFDKNEEDNTIFSVKFKVIDASALISAWVFKAFDRNGNSVDIDVNDVWLDSLTNQSLIGDVNRDGKISVADARKIVVAVANGTQNELIEFGDVNGDNKVSVADARKIVDNIAKNIF